MSILRLEAVRRPSVSPAIPAQRVGFLHRALIERIMFPGQDPGQGQTVDVAIRFGRTGRFLFIVHPGHPARHDAASVLVQKRLGRVKVEAAVKALPGPAGLEDAEIFVKGAGYVRGVAVHDLAPAVRGGFTGLGTAHQNFRSLQGKEVRTLADLI